MIIKLREIYRDVTSTSSPQSRMRYRARDIFINSKHIIYVRKNTDMNKRLVEGLLDSDTGESFCTISLSRGSSGTDIIVVGSLEELNKKFNLASKEMIYG